MKFKDIPKDEQASYIAFIDERFRQVNSLSQGWTDKVFQYLMLTNSGGAVAVLTFLGSSSEGRALIQLWLSLGFFVLGVILVGVNTAILFLRIDDVTRGLLTDIRAFYNGAQDWEKLNSNDDKRSEIGKLAYQVGWASFVCFIMGALIGLLVFFFYSRIAR